MTTFKKWCAQPVNDDDIVGMFTPQTDNPNAADPNLRFSLPCPLCPVAITWSRLAGHTTAIATHISNEHYKNEAFLANRIKDREAFTSIIKDLVRLIWKQRALDNDNVKVKEIRDALTEFNRKSVLYLRADDEPVDDVALTVVREKEEKGRKAIEEEEIQMALEKVNDERAEKRAAEIGAEQNIQLGIEFFEKSMINNATGDEVNLKEMKDVKKIEAMLNGNGMLRKNVTEKLEDAFERQGYRDLYTKWSMADYEEYEEQYSPPNTVHSDYLHPALAFRLPSRKREDSAEKEKEKRFCEVDHIWELQLIAVAVREVGRFGTGLTLTDLVITFDVINDLPNLNGTTHKLNAYKGKVMTQFKSKYNVKFNGINSLSSILQGYHEKMFLKPIPLFLCDEKYIKKKKVLTKDDLLPTGEAAGNKRARGTDSATASAAADSQPAAEEVSTTSETPKNTALENIQSALEMVLVTHFYDELWIKGSATLKLLYSVLCHMFYEMFPRSTLRNGSRV